MANGKGTTDALQVPALYTPAGFYLLRAPALPADTFLRMMIPSEKSKPDNTEESLDTRLIVMRQHTYNMLKELASEPFVQQALTVASRDISEALTHILSSGGSTRRLERAYASLLRYCVRMCTRSTPFGLFAGVALGHLDETTCVTLGIPGLQAMRTRPDMHWLFTLIEKIESDWDLLPRQTVVVNHMVYLAGGRVVLPQADVYGKHDQRSIDIRSTPVVRFVLKHAMFPVLYTDLHSALLSNFPRATEQKVDGLLHQLWEHHILLSDLRPPLSSADPTAYVLERLRCIPAAASTAQMLQEVLTAAREVDRAGIGSSPLFLANLVAQQKRLIPEEEEEKPHYQVDATLCLEATQVQQAVGEAVAQAAETLLRLGRAPRGSSHLRDYYQAFVERYGMEAEIPLLELLSPESGLDAPPGYLNPPRTYSLPNSQPMQATAQDRRLCALLVETLTSGANEMELTEARVQQLAQWTPGTGNTPCAALEMFVQIQAASQEAMNRGEWRVVLAPSSMSTGGRTFGRFFDILGDEALVRLQAYSRRQEALSPEIIFAELCYLPASGHGANVAMRPQLRDYEIVVNTTPSVPWEKVIHLDDLVVGVHGEHFYLRSQRLGRQVIATQSHQLNALQAPNVCRFLLEVSQDTHPGLFAFNWGIAEGAPFLPRVVQKQVVLSSAQWNLCLAQIELGDFGSEEARWFVGIQKWRERWKVPRFVYLPQLDNRLLLDLEHPLSLAELRSTLKKIGVQDSVPLQETLPSFEHLWLRDTNNRPYFAELVVPLSLRDSATGEDAPPQVSQTHSHVERTTSSRPNGSPRIISIKERRQLPGGPWIYLKLYAAARQHDEIITRALREGVRRINEQCQVDRWFYIRYADPEPHLRVRFHAADIQQSEQILRIALDWSREVALEGLIGRVCVDCYEREIERYGGPEAIDTLEYAFTVNSDAVSALVAGLYLQEITLDPLAVAVFSLDHLFAAWGLDVDARLSFLRSRTEKYAFSQEFRSQRRLFCELLVPWHSDNDLALHHQREQVQRILSVQDQVLAEAAVQVRDLAARGELWQMEETIMGSLVHMHLNRLLGWEREQEQKVYAFWRQTLESLQRRPVRNK